ncbi:MAG: SusC/RagA family TonB-linked outer membrane protein [Bacteroidales bacterium]
MKRFVFVLSLLCLVGFNLLQGQGVQVTGNVTSADDGTALPGVSVVVRGTTIGAVTDFEGNYSITAPDASATLMFSFVGMLTQEIALNGQTVVDAVLESTSTELDEVVVTALGVSREKKSLGYSVQEVDGDAVSGSAQSNFASSLSGKVAGVQIKGANTMGGSSNVLIRGSTSINGNNQPLYVIDGVPVDNSNYSTGADGWGGYDYGNLAQDINPNDVESISILKGAAASALYGSRAANGVILVTTKKGGTKKGIGVSVSSNFMVGQVDKSTLPQQQFEYGGGYGPFYEDETGYFFFGDVDGDGTNDLITPTSEDASWGAKFDPNLMVVQWEALDPSAANYGQKTPWMAPPEGHRMPSFFENNTKWVNTVAFDGGNKDGRFRVSYTNYSENGILPNSELNKNTLNFSGSYNFGKRLTVSANVTYNHQKTLGRMGTGYDGINVMQSFGQWFQTNVDFENLKEYESPSGLHRTWNYSYWDDLSPIFFDNPYWVRYKNYEDDYRDRVLGYVSADYKLTEWLTFTARTAVDTYHDVQNERTAIGSTATSGFTTRQRNMIESNTDLMLKFNKNFDQISVNGLVGANYRFRQQQRITANTVGGLVVPELYTVSNSVSPMGVTEYLGIGDEQSLYGNLSVGYGGFVYIEGTARVDQSSSLKGLNPEADYTYFYPSIAGTFLIHELGGMKDIAWMNYLKVRANYAKVGAATDPYRTVSTYDQNTNWGNMSLFSVANILQNPNLRPEFTNSIELGLEAFFFDSRVGLDLAVYKTNSFDQIFNVPVSRASGYSSMYVNGGEMENKGIEVALHLVPVKSNDFTWNLDVNWFANRNMVISLAEGVTSLQLFSAWDVKVTADEGYPYGTLKGTDYVWTDGKRTVLDNGYLAIGDDPLAVLGDVQPDWNMGIGNRLTWKGVSLYALIDIQKGGDIYSVNTKYGQATGVYAETVGNNPKGNPMRDRVADGGGNIFEDAVFSDGTPNDVYVEAFRWGRYWYYNNSPTARYVFDASYVKLRELSLSYSLPKSVLGDSFIRGVDIALVGRNLWIISKNVEHFDPEYILTSGNGQGVEQGAYPSVKSYGVNVKLNF